MDSSAKGSFVLFGYRYILTRTMPWYRPLWPLLGFKLKLRESIPANKYTLNGRPVPAKPSGSAQHNVLPVRSITGLPRRRWPVRGRDRLHPASGTTRCTHRRDTLARRRHRYLVRPRGAPISLVYIKASTAAFFTTGIEDLLAIGAVWACYASNRWFASTSRCPAARPSSRRPAPRNRRTRPSARRPWRHTSARPAGRWRGSANLYRGRRRRYNRIFRGGLSVRRTG
jgi:hypothetical protein